MIKEILLLRKLVDRATSYLWFLLFYECLLTGKTVFDHLMHFLFEKLIMIGSDFI